VFGDDIIKTPPQELWEFKNTDNLNVNECIVFGLTPGAERASLARSEAQITVSENDRIAREREALAKENVAKSNELYPALFKASQRVIRDAITAAAILLIGYLGVTYCPEANRHYVLWACALGIGGLLVYRFLKRE
jgi:hypothetical protein